MTPQTIIIVVSEDWYFMSHRLPLACALRDAGHRVVVCTNFNEHRSAIEEMGFFSHDLGLKRNKISPKNLLKYFKLEKELKEKYKPVLIINVAIFTLIISFIGNFLSSVKKMHILTGMGYIYTDDTPVTRTIRFICSIYFRFLSLMKRHTIIVQNGDDCKFFENHGFVTNKSLFLIAGSGVDCETFKPPAKPYDQPVVTCVARMLEAKGIRELIEAAKILKEKGRDYIFNLVGPTDPANPQSLDASELENLSREGIVNWLGPQDNIAELNQKTRLGVLPSWREGMPKSLLEAAASGLPLVTYDVTGCRDVVKDGDNGYTVPFKDVSSLATAIEKIMEDPELRLKMGARSRKLAETQFSAPIISNKFLDVIKTQIEEVSQ